MMARSDWSIQGRAEGFIVFWRGREWPSDPYASREAAEEYVLRLCARYPGETPGILLGDEDEPDKDRKRGGPWRYRYPTDDGEEEGVIQVSAKSDAKDILRRKLDRKRLPNGIEWEIAQEMPPP